MGPMDGTHSCVQKTVFSVPTGGPLRASGWRKDVFLGCGCTLVWRRTAVGPNVDTVGPSSAVGSVHWRIVERAVGDHLQCRYCRPWARMGEQALTGDRWSSNRMSGYMLCRFVSLRCLLCVFFLSSSRLPRVATVSPACRHRVTTVSSACRTVELSTSVDTVVLSGVLSMPFGTGRSRK
eukprot:gene8669-biopygen22651